MRKIIVTLLISLFHLSATAQIRGAIVDGKKGDPIPGVKILLSSGEKTSANIAGEFILKPAKYPVKLIISSFGYESDSLWITKDTTFVKSLYVESIQIKTVVVTAGRRAQEIEEVPISMEILRPELINNKGIANLEQAVDQSPGVYAMDGQVSIRGGGGYSYGAGSRVMLLWNGVPMLSPDIGDAKWNSIPMEQTSQIEVIKGASSVLYGSGALNGIISLTEKEPTIQGKLAVKVQSGVYDNPRRASMKWWNKNPTFHLVDIYGGKAFKKFGASFGANMYLDSGYRQGESEKRFRINGSFFLRSDKLTKLKTGLSYNFQYQDVNMFILWKNDSSCYQPMDNTLSRQKAIRLNIDPYLKFVDNKNNKHYLRTRYYLVTTGNNQNYKDASFAQLFYTDYQFQKSILSGVNLTAGATANVGTVKSWVFQNHISQNYAAYSQVEAKFKKLDLTGGMRLEYYKLDTMSVDSRFEYLDSLFIPVYPIFRLGSHYALNKASHLRMSLGQGVRFPSIAERYVSTSVGGLIIFKNPNLRPEKGWSGEIGFKQIVKIGKSWKGYLDVAGFINEYSNMTEFTFGVYNPLTGDKLTWLGYGIASPEDSAIWNALTAQGVDFNQCVGFRAVNAEKARISGIEFAFNSQGRIGPIEVTSLVGYTYMNPISLNTDSIYKQTFSDTSTNILKYRFRHMAKSDIQLGYKNFELGFSTRFNSLMINIDKVFEEPIGTQEILPGLKEYREKNKKGAFVVDLRIAYSIKKQYRFNFIVNNLLNAEYASRPGDIQAPRNFILQFQCNL
ncbi:MAG: TonB-dependent receptor [Bacteroidetes bacterium]|nr:TonB-dependent receptor [Bacteroidota bacterium]